MAKSTKDKALEDIKSKAAANEEDDQETEKRRSEEAREDQVRHESEDVSEPSEAIAEEGDVPDIFVGRDAVTDSVPGAVTELTPEHEDDVDYREPIPVGAWAKLADTDNVTDQGGEVGQLVYVTESVKKLCADPECEFSPREHYHQDPNVSIIVRGRDERGQTFRVSPEDLENVSTGRSSVLPVG